MKCTLNFLQMPLSKLPKAFGFDHVTQKGTFPHFFNTPENQDYVGPMPDLSYYDLQGIKEEDARALRAWHQAEVARGTSSRILRTKFLEEKTIGLIPTRGYRGHDVQSLKALQWLKYIEHREGEGVFIQHAGNRGEVRLAGRIKVDGYAESTNTLREHTRAVELRLKAQGYNYEEVWECQFDAQLNTHPELRALVGDVEHGKPLEARDAFFGGRTNAIRLHCEANVEQCKEIHYDFTSLYPWVNAMCDYPVGHPDAILTENFKEDLHAYKGLMKLRILPPRDLFFPVLPVRVNDKLMFSLCHRCAQVEEQGSCTHLDEERAFTGTLAHCEIYKVLEKGYCVICVYEVWHWERWAPLFEEYIKTFLKYKQETSGWLGWCTTDADKMQYVDDYERHQGVRMDPSKIEKNPGLHSVAKMGLNCMWGKFGEQPNPQRTEYVDDPKAYFALLNNNSIEVHDVLIVNDGLIQVHYRLGEKSQELKPHTNVVIAAFTTAYARLKLYDVLNGLGERCLYHDTDSVILLHRPGEWKPPLGDHLGDLTSELEPGDFIDRYSSTGPKSYGYTTQRVK
ncbi:uncharacterized protein LOC116616861 [Nematostella vectensis]|uniref:uncharacterized protein LOC116616861 n=1 Tax=Nematostella vectensis TaxID=45351 RepID=UPI00139015F4|nr:uncharacterized protein LOC116616861 [Nematostella vectensis]